MKTPGSLVNFSIYHQMKQGTISMKFTKDKRTNQLWGERCAWGREANNGQVFKKLWQHYLHFWGLQILGGYEKLLWKLLPDFKLNANEKNAYHQKTFSKTSLKDSLISLIYSMIWSPIF